MSDPPLASVVVPVWQDEDALRRTLDGLGEEDAFEVIVACVVGEESRYLAHRHRYPTVRWVSAPRGRGAQMNAAAAVAQGRWFLFLHADSSLPPNWLEGIRKADARPEMVAGAFRFALDSRDWRARVIEAGVRMRVAVLWLPYGDQALFIRRDTFAALGGYRDLPLMEDVDLVRRLKRAGHLWLDRSPVTTSARRWERDGWIGRSARNLLLAVRFALGGSPARLAQRYFGRKPEALVLMARAPSAAGKTRLALHLDPRSHAELRRAILLDTLDVLKAIDGVQPIVACEPAEAVPSMREIAGPHVDVIAQRGGDLGDRMARVFEDVFRLGAESIVLIGSDLPDLPPDLPRQALAVLRRRGDRVVLGPATDGGYYLIGMTRVHPEAFHSIDWSAPHVLEQTTANLNAHGVPFALLQRWTDIDTPGDLSHLLEKSPEGRAPRTRAWAIASGMPGRRA